MNIRICLSIFLICLVLSSISSMVSAGNKKNKNKKKQQETQTEASITVKDYNGRQFCEMGVIIIEGDYVYNQGFNAGPTHNLTQTEWEAVFPGIDYPVPIFLSINDLPVKLIFSDDETLSRGIGMIFYAVPIRYSTRDESVWFMKDLYVDALTLVTQNAYNELGTQNVTDKAYTMVFQLESKTLASEVRTPTPYETFSLTMNIIYTFYKGSKGYIIFDADENPYIMSTSYKLYGDELDFEFNNNLTLPSGWSKKLVILKKQVQIRPNDDGLIIFFQDEYRNNFQYLEPKEFKKIKSQFKKSKILNIGVNTKKGPKITAPNAIYLPFGIDTEDFVKTIKNLKKLPNPNPNPNPKKLLKPGNSKKKNPNYLNFGDFVMENKTFLAVMFFGSISVLINIVNCYYNQCKKSKYDAFSKVSNMDSVGITTTTTDDSEAQSSILS